MALGAQAPCSKINTIVINALDPRVEMNDILRYFPSSSSGKDTDSEEQSQLLMRYIINVKTLQTMRNEATFKMFYDEAMQLAEDLDIEVIDPHARKISRRMNENYHNLRRVSGNEENFHVAFYFQVIDIMVSEFER